MGKKSYYQLLNIKPDASIDEIKRAYREKAREIHPDKNLNIDTTQEFQKLNEAYQVLSDEIKRKDYDNGFVCELNFNIFNEHENEKELESDFIYYETDITVLKCGCDDWIKSRSQYQSYDPRRLCKHLVAKLVNDGIPEVFMPFKNYLLYRKSTGRGVKLFQEIVFLEFSIVVIDYYGTHLFLYLKKQKDSFCSYQVFEVHKYKGVGYKWMITPDILNEGEILYEDNIDGKDYINKRFNVINGNAPLCNRLYKRYLYEEKLRLKDEYKSRFEITSKILKQVESKYSTLSFNTRLQAMGYIVKSKDLNGNDWIVREDGLKYGINYLIDTLLPNVEMPSWYISTFYDSKTMSFKHSNQKDTTHRTKIMWDKQKFQELLLVMDAFVIKKEQKLKEEKVSYKRSDRMDWLKDINCPQCNSKNIHKKNKRVYKYGTVQRYQCMDCKSVFQEKVDEHPLEKENINISNDVENEKSENFNE
jgi:hypothetical protein